MNEVLLPALCVCLLAYAWWLGVLGGCIRSARQPVESRLVAAGLDIFHSMLPTLYDTLMSSIIFPSLPSLCSSPFLLQNIPLPQCSSLHQLYWHLLVESASLAQHGQPDQSSSSCRMPAPDASTALKGCSTCSRLLIGECTPELLMSTCCAHQESATVLQEEKAAAAAAAEEAGEPPKLLATSYDSLRQVPSYAAYISERFERCLDLYLCPRTRR